MNLEQGHGGNEKGDHGSDSDSRPVLTGGLLACYCVDHLQGLSFKQIWWSLVSPFFL